MLPWATSTTFAAPLFLLRTGSWYIPTADATALRSRSTSDASSCGIALLLRRFDDEAVAAAAVEAEAMAADRERLLRGGSGGLHHPILLRPLLLLLLLLPLLLLRIDRRGSTGLPLLLLLPVCNCLNFAAAAEAARRASAATPTKETPMRARTITDR